MEILKICILVLVAVFVAGCIPTFSKEISILLTFFCCTVVLLYILKQVTPAVEYIRNMAQSINFAGTEVIFKSVGVGFVTQFVSDTASDCGNKALANQMIFAGRICILMLAIPVFRQVFEIIERLL